MKGSTHLWIGAGIGTAAALSVPFHPGNAAMYLSAAAFSALAADLDGPSLLVGKLSKISRRLRHFALWAGLLLVGAGALLYFYRGWFSLQLTAAAVIILLFGLVTSQGTIRNGLVSLIGIGVLYAGASTNQAWLLELGIFAAWAPWLKHRGMTHTVWALLLWWKIGWGLETRLNLEGIAATMVAGYASHLLADMFTPSGVKLLFPLYKKSFKFLP